MIKVVVGAALGVVGLVALLLGQLAFTVLVLALAAAVLLDLSVLVAGAGARPVIPVALVPGLVLPAMVAADVSASPDAGWDRIPGAFAVAFLLGFVLVLVFGRRGGAVAGLGATAMVSLLVGLGACGLLLLRGLPDGFRWILGLAVLTVAADVAGPAVRRFRQRSYDEDPGLLLDHSTAPLEGVMPALVAAALTGGALVVLLAPPLSGLIMVMLVLIAVVAALGGAFLQRTLSAEAGTDPDDPGGRLGEGVLVGAVDALMLAAPAAYVLARSVAL